MSLSRSSIRSIAEALLEVDWQRSVGKIPHGIEDSRAILNQLSNQLESAAKTYSRLKDYPYARLALDRMIQKIYGTGKYLEAHDSAIANFYRRLSDLDSLAELTKFAAEIEITDWGDLRPAQSHAPDHAKENTALERLLAAISRSCGDVASEVKSKAVVYDAAQQLLAGIGYDISVKVLRNRFPASTLPTG
jgi:hypothetical protein